MANLCYRTHRERERERKRERGVNEFIEDLKIQGKLKRFSRTTNKEVSPKDSNMLLESFEEN